MYNVYNENVSVSIDFTDVTLVSEDTYGDNEVGGDEENYKGEEG